MGIQRMSCFFGSISVQAFAVYVAAWLSCMVPWDAEDPKAESKVELQGDSTGEAKEGVSKVPGDLHPVDQIWRNAIQSTFVEPAVAALAEDKSEKERAKLTDFLLRFLDVLRVPAGGGFALCGMVRDFYLMANLWTKEFRDRRLDPSDSKDFFNIAKEFSEKYYDFKWPEPGGNPGRHNEKP